MRKSKAQKKIEEHEALANHFAEASHKFEAPISDALSGLAEAHQHYADVLREPANPKGKGE